MLRTCLRMASSWRTGALRASRRLVESPWTRPLSLMLKILSSRFRCANFLLVVGTASCAIRRSLRLMALTTIFLEPILRNISFSWRPNRFVWPSATIAVSIPLLQDCLFLVEFPSSGLILLSRVSMIFFSLTLCLRLGSYAFFRIDAN